jgi:hypothetical protein
MADVRRVCQNMWDRGREEMQHWPGATPELWLEDWRRRIERGDAVAFGDEAILAWDRASHGVVYTAFHATREFENPGVGKRITKELRRAIPQLMRDRRVAVCFVLSLCVTPDAPKWFRLLGFEEDSHFEPRPCGPHFMRRFIRRI